MKFPNCNGLPERFFFEKLILKIISRQQKIMKNFPACNDLTLKAPITTAADDKICDIFSNLTFHENRLLADDSHEISCLICYF